MPEIIQQVIDQVTNRIYYLLNDNTVIQHDFIDHHNNENKYHLKMRKQNAEEITYKEKNV